MTRKILSYLLALSLILGLALPLQAQDGEDPLRFHPLAIVLTIDSTIVTQGRMVLPEPPIPPQIINGRTMLPFRYLVQTIFGGEVFYDADTQEIRAEVDGHTFIMLVDDPQIIIDGDGYVYSQAPVIIGESTLVPLRAFEILLSELAWDEATQTVALLPAHSLVLSPEEVTAKFMQLLIEGNFTELETILHPDLVLQFESMGGTEVFVAILSNQVGTILEVTSIEYTGDQGIYKLVSVSAETDLGPLVLMVVIDDQAKVAGLQVLASVEAALGVPEGFEEIPVVVDAGNGYPLEGRLAVPIDRSDAFPLVVLVQGSGATNYDEIVGAQRVFGRLAYGLAQRGIASLRFSKRTFEYPLIAQAKDFSVYDEYVEDVLAAFELALDVEGVDPQQLYLLGHSQGGMLAPLFLAEGAPAAGMILFAGSPRSFTEILADQQADMLAFYETMGMTDLVESYLVMQEQWVAEYAALKEMTPEEAMEAGTVYEMNAYYLLTLDSVDTIGLIRELATATLIMQGSNDHQV
ncbi:MAG: stalk domain-containing protein, partial [Symbiobacteriaceae bacterium]|nr:stalk domain-containing protein [Symbiobacteriaceae bacterium]